MFLCTLKDNKPAFVDLFMENNFDADKFISEKILKELYAVRYSDELLNYRKLIRCTAIKTVKKTIKKDYCILNNFN